MGVDAAVFEAVHGTAPDIAGKNLANPMALLMSAIMMLRHIGEPDRADAVMRAMVAVLSEGSIRTRDLGGASTTTEFADAICRHVEGGGAPATR
jgi:isocitrate dehydrogenase (NAD+)